MFIPHITLFTLQIEKNSLKQLYQEIRRVLKNVEKFNLKISRHSYYIEPDGLCWTGLKIKNSSELYQLQRKLYKNLKQFDKKALNLKPYSPHITLTRFKNRLNAIKATRSSHIPSKTFIADTLAVCQDGSYSQVKAILKKFKFPV